MNAASLSASAAQQPIESCDEGDQRAFCYFPYTDIEGEAIPV
jgi:hypothetical protein